MVEDSTSRIFVQIAAYRDPECQWTVRDLFLRAKYPDRVSVGICWQFIPEEDYYCFLIQTRPGQVKVLTCHALESRGVCWARHETQLLWEGEEYTLVIDSHSRFIEHWDVKMIDELKQCDAAKPLLTNIPAAYKPPNELAKNPMPTIKRARPFDDSGDIRTVGEFLHRKPEKPLHGAFVAGGFMFSSAQVIREVPYDPYLFFSQEEIVYAARLFTHGWDVFHPHDVMVYHYYNDQKINTRPLQWRDNKQWSDQNKIGHKRYNHLLGYEESADPEILKEMDTYGLGTERTLHEFEDFCGVYFNTRQVTERAMQCLFIPDIQLYVNGRLNVPELAEQKEPRSGQKPAESADNAPPVLQSAALPPALSKNENVSVPVSGGALALGDYVPWFELTDSEGSKKQVQAYGGSPLAIIFIPPAKQDVQQHVHDALVGTREAYTREGIYVVLVIPLAPKEAHEIVDALQFSQRLWCDSDRALCQAFGIETLIDRQPVSFLADTNLKLRATCHDPDPKAHFQALLAAHMQMREREPQPRLMARLAPVLMVPDAISADFCGELVAFFEQGKKYEGHLGAGGKFTVNRDFKRRDDVDVNDPALLTRIDEALSRSLFPEIRKVASFDVRYREPYKIARYLGEEQGHYGPHRDTFLPLSFRRYSLSLWLNDDFEGGGMSFPEYGKDIYRGTTGTALAFPSTLMHQVLPVTKGKRYVALSFMFGEDEVPGLQALRITEGHSGSMEGWKIKAGHAFKGLKIGSAYTQTVTGPAKKM